MQLICRFLQYTVPFLNYIHRNIYKTLLLKFKPFYLSTGPHNELIFASMPCLWYPKQQGHFFLNTNNFFRWINISGYVLGWLYGRPWKAPYDCNKSIQGKLEHQSPFENVFIMSLWHLWWTRNKFVPTVSPLNHTLRSWKEMANR